MKNEDIVRTGYNKIAAKYNASRDQFNNETELEYFISLLPKRGRILDAGCGAGVPVAKYLVDRGYSVTGIDFSTSMLNLARQQVPEAEFLEGDMTHLTLPANSFDGVVSTYAIIHVPKEKHATIYQNFFRVLKPGGVLSFCTGSDKWEATADYMGTTMFWSHPTKEASLALVKEAGFEIIRDEVLECGGEHPYWIFARK
jgi:ubiquinone/menaquinone biosynthesis C-methylase UbiE